MMGYHDLSAAGGRRVSTQNRAVRGEQDAQSEGHEGGEAAAVGGVQVEPMRLRAMQRRWIQRKANGGGGAAAASIPGGPGAPLGGGVQSRMERTLGADLSGVRVHTGGDSAEAAEGLGARAFTVGSDVHFGRGEFAPGSREGDRLLAHELTHVVQGQKSGVQRKAAPATAKARAASTATTRPAATKSASPATRRRKRPTRWATTRPTPSTAAATRVEASTARVAASTAAARRSRRRSRKWWQQRRASAARIFRAPKPGAGSAAPATKPAPAGAGGGGAGGQQQANAPQDPAEAAEEKQIDLVMTAMAGLDSADPTLAVRVALSMQTIEQKLAKYPANDIVKAFKTYLTVKRAAILEKCQEDMAGLQAQLDAIDEKKPDSAKALEQLKSSPLMQKWDRNAVCGTFTATKHPRIQAFQASLQKKSTENQAAVQKQKEEQEKAQAAPPGGSSSAAGGAAKTAGQQPPAATGAAGNGAAAPPASASATTATPGPTAQAQPAPAPKPAPTPAPAPTSAPTSSAPAQQVPAQPAAVPPAGANQANAADASAGAKAPGADVAAAAPASSAQQPATAATQAPAAQPTTAAPAATAGQQQGPSPAELRMKIVMASLEESFERMMRGAEAVEAGVSLAIAGGTLVLGPAAGGIGLLMNLGKAAAAVGNKIEELRRLHILSNIIRNLDEAQVAQLAGTWGDQVPKFADIMTQFQQEYEQIRETQSVGAGLAGATGEGVKKSAGGLSGEVAETALEAGSHALSETGKEFMEKGAGHFFGPIIGSITGLFGLAKNFWDVHKLVKERDELKQELEEALLAQGGAPAAPAAAAAPAPSSSTV